MFLILKPSEAEIRAHLDHWRGAPLNYPEVGATGGQLPSGYSVDQRRTPIGRGEASFERARAGLFAWAMYPASWITICFPDPPKNDEVVATLVQVNGVWTLNACRISRVVDETQGTRRRASFTWGTLLGHAEAGEERFLVEWDRETDQVDYEILAFSRPVHPFARLFHQLLRRLQGQFFDDSHRLMLALGQGAPNPNPNPNLNPEPDAAKSA